MKTTRVLIHGFILVLFDLAGVALGALAAFQLTGHANQFAVQVPMAVALSILLFVVWALVLRAFKLHSLLAQPEDFGFCFVASLVWGVVLLVPVHYFTQGYLTGIGNVIALMVYQVPVNAIALLVAIVLTTAKPRDGSTAVL